MKSVQLLLIHFIDLWSRHTSNPFKKFALFGFCFRFVRNCDAFMFRCKFFLSWFGFTVASANYSIIIHCQFGGLEYSVSWKANLEKTRTEFFAVANHFSFAQFTSMEINELDYISPEAIHKSSVRTFFFNFRWIRHCNPKPELRQWRE